MALPPRLLVRDGLLQVGQRTVVLPALVVDLGDDLVAPGDLQLQLLLFANDFTAHALEGRVLPRVSERGSRKSGGVAALGSPAAPLPKSNSPRRIVEKMTSELAAGVGSKRVNREARTQLPPLFAMPSAL